MRDSQFMHFIQDRDNASVNALRFKYGIIESIHYNPISEGIFSRQAMAEMRAYLVAGVFYAPPGSRVYTESSS